MNDTEFIEYVVEGGNIRRSHLQEPWSAAIRVLGYVLRPPAIKEDIETTSGGTRRPVTGAEFNLMAQEPKRSTQNNESTSSRMTDVKHS